MSKLVASNFCNEKKNPLVKILITWPLEYYSVSYHKRKGIITHHSRANFARLDHHKKTNMYAYHIINDLQ